MEERDKKIIWSNLRQDSLCASHVQMMRDILGTFCAPLYVFGERFVVITGQEQLIWMTVFHQ